MRERDARPHRASRRRPMLWLLLSACAAVGLAWAWHAGFVPDRDWLAQRIDDATRLRDSPLAMPACVLAFVAGGLVACPVNLLIAASVVVLGPWKGGACALAGVLASAGVLHAIGRRLPARWTAPLRAPRWRRVRSRLLAHGVLAVALVRLVPVGPYSVISLLAGLVGVRRGDYYAGTALGMLPGIVLYAAFADRARAALANPGPRAWLAVAAVVAAIVVLAGGLAWWSRREGRR